MRRFARESVATEDRIHQKNAYLIMEREIEKQENLIAEDKTEQLLKDIEI